MDKDVGHSYSGMLLGSKKGMKFGSFVETGMDLGSIIQSEISQKEKTKYQTLTHIHVIQKNGTDEPSSRAGVETQTWRMNVWTQRIYD